ncbi:hypothetical protein [Streptomyces beihaiensis]|uniref:Lipoprotein n=1 Tax=Streptomyces beihaiensis TaxID=2984495 RepID=A0ABT3U1Q8_9ACTN|nr:hypothetical protein [Streptomyces beihaiensis]MCX3063234.1 hypothetical protein [Streptomyces beihaiensis]
MGDVVRNKHVWVVTAAAVAALAVTGCSSANGGGNGGNDGNDKGKPSDGASSPSGSSGGSAGSVKDAEGIWSATTGGRPVVLVVGGKQASLSTGDGHLCSGAVADAGKPTISLTCADGDTTRSLGTVASNDGTTMKVAWDGGTTDTFTKSENGKLPNLPSALPSGLAGGVGTG